MEVILDLSNPTFKLDGDLDPYQKRVVESKSDFICVISEPATGKTKVVQNKGLWCLNNFFPEDILPITFTISARNVMNDRFGEVIKAYGIHSHGFRKSPTNRGLFLKSLEFNDLLHPRRPIEGLYEWVICDEGQDLTPKQYERFISLGKRLMLVGDPWQSLYSYPEAGADPTLLDKFTRDFNAECLPLRINHRSRRAIVEVANKFSGRNSEWEREGGLVYLGWKDPDLHNLTILVRTNREVSKWGEALKVIEIPFTKIIDQGKGRQRFDFGGIKEEEIKSLEIPNLPTLICTIHCAKGNEWDRILLDYRRQSFMEDDELEERIFYVGLTRAKEELFIYPEYMPFIRRIE